LTCPDTAFQHSVVNNAGRFLTPSRFPLKHNTGETFSDFSEAVINKFMFVIPAAQKVSQKRFE
jgi:hypothetical protein